MKSTKSNPLNSSELYDEAVKVLYDVVYDACKSQPQRTEFMLKPQPNHDFSNQIAKKNVKKLLDLIAKHTQEARIDIEDYIKLLPANWYRGEFILTYDRNADKWVAGYGNASATSVLPTGVADSPLEAIKMLYEYLVKDGKITDSLATLKPKTGGK